MTHDNRHGIESDLERAAGYAYTVPDKIREHDAAIGRLHSRCDDAQRRIYEAEDEHQKLVRRVDGVIENINLLVAEMRMKHYEAEDEHQDQRMAVLKGLGPLREALANVLKECVALGMTARSIGTPKSDSDHSLSFITQHGIVDLHCDRIPLHIREALTFK